jgi:hypothetical protein
MTKEIENTNQRFQISKVTPEGFQPCVLLGKEFDVESFRQEISRHYALEAAAIQDAYPCTPLQEGLM